MGYWGVLLFAFCLATVSESTSHAHQAREPGWCGSNAWEGMKRDAHASCGTQHLCDNPEKRDEHRIRPNSRDIKVNMIWIVFGRQDPEFSKAIHGQMETVNKYFRNSRISFVPTIKWVFDARFNGIYSPFDGIRMDSMKLNHADSPFTQLNIFIPGGLDFEVTGWATFPHNMNALNSTGGIIMDRAAIGAERYAFVHQIGHAFGLYHTFEGSYLKKLDTPDVTVPCDICAEFAGFPTDFKGDLCSDTPPTNENYKCQDPEERDCNYQNYVDTAFMNPMGYGSDACVKYGGFTEQQIARMRCFLATPPKDGGLSSWVNNPTCESNEDCNDYNVCTNDKCVDGTCVFKGISCTTSRRCHDSFCNIETGRCEVVNRTCDNIIPEQLKDCARSNCNPLKNKCRIDVKRCGKYSNFQSDCCRESREPFCADVNLASCVCEFQPSCCVDRWDANCVLAAANCGRDCLAEKLALPNNTKCTSSRPVGLSEQVLYAKNTARDVSKFRCYDRDIIMAGVWYYLEAEDDKMVEINTCFAHNNLLTHVFVFENCTGECILWGEGNEACLNQAITEFPTMAGTNYSIFIGSESLGTITVRIDESPRRGIRGSYLAAILVSLVVFVVLVVIGVIAFIFKGGIPGQSSSSSNNYQPADYD